MDIPAYFSGVILLCHYINTACMHGRLLGWLATWPDLWAVCCALASCQCGCQLDSAVTWASTLCLSAARCSQTTRATGLIFERNRPYPYMYPCGEYGDIPSRNVDAIVAATQLLTPGPPSGRTDGRPDGRRQDDKTSVFTW